MPRWWWKEDCAMSPAFIQNPKPAPTSSKKVPRLALAALWLTAFIPHLAVALAFLYTPIALDDMFQYDMLARSLVEGRGYRWYSQADVQTLKPYLEQFLDVGKMQVPPDGLETTFRAPGYPFFLAAIYAFVPTVERFAAARLAQAALLALLAPASALIALKLGGSRRAAVASGLAMAFYPILLLYTAGLASENLFIPLLAWGVLAVIAAVEKRSVPRAVLAGLLLGASMLTRSIVAPFILLAAFWIWREGGSRRQALVFLAVAFGLCLPWAVRNSRIMGRPSFVETGMGYNLYIGYHPAGNGGFVSSIAIAPLTILDDAERDRVTTQQAIGFIRADPLGSAWKVLQRGVYFFGVEDRELMYFYSNNFFGAIQQPWLALAYLALVLPWVIGGLLALLGLAGAPSRPVSRLLLGLILAYAAPHLLILAEPRFHLALVPVALPLAAVGWAQRKSLFNRLLAGRDLGAWALRLSPLLLVLLWIWGIGLHWQQLLILLGPGGNHARWTY
jgi:hypothetical protein